MLIAAIIILSVIIAISILGLFFLKSASNDEYEKRHSQPNLLN